VHAALIRAEPDRPDGREDAEGERTHRICR
jgi:hypothetical protein